MTLPSEHFECCTLCVRMSSWKKLKNKVQVWMSDFGVVRANSFLMVT